jgi:hypothetical protein
LNIKTYDRTIKLKYETVEDSIVSLLYALSILDDNEEVIAIDFGLPVDDNGFVEFDLTCSKPVNRATQLSLAFNNEDQSVS